MNSNITTNNNESNSEFDKSRSRLISEIAENLAKCVTNINQLNRNIESVSVVGTGFEPVHKLWKEFESVMSNARVSTQTTEEPILTTNIPINTMAPPGSGEIPELQTEEFVE